MTDDIQNETGFVSLLDLANTNTDEVQTILTRLPSPGIYIVKGTSVAGSQSDPVDDKPPLIRFAFEVEILGAKLVDKKADVQQLVGRKLKDSYTLWPNQMEELIGLLKGRYQKAGLPNTGKPGGVEGAPPGWLDSMVGAIWQMRVYTFMQKGQPRAGYDWIGPAPSADESAAA